MTDKAKTTQVYRIVIKASAQAIWDGITKPEWSERYAYGGRVHYELKAGGHYQHTPFPEGGMASDPMYANKDNEAWLDFRTDDDGHSERSITVDWVPRDGEAKAIIFHHMVTQDGGVAGPKLACLPLDGF